MKSITLTLTQIVKAKPEEETKPLVVNGNDISIRSKNGKTYVTKHHPVERRYIVKESEDEIKDMIENAYAEHKAESQPPHYDFSRDLSILVKITDDIVIEIEYDSDEYDSFYYNNTFLVIIKDNIVIREISKGKIISVSYNKKEEK